MLQKILLSLSLSVSLASCSTVDIEDHEWCVDAGTDGAFCFHTISDKERELTEEEWAAESRGWFCGSAQAYANLKEAVLKLCESSKQCRYEEEENLKKFFTKVEKAQEKAEIQPLPHHGRMK